MSYLHISNLYQDRRILLFKEVYAMEKIHGTSAHIGYNGRLYFFSGGSSHDVFIRLFDHEKLLTSFQNIGTQKCVIYGESYGGKCQGMRETYGNEMRFVAFEVMIGDRWLCVPDAEQIVNSFGLEFVPYQKIPTDIETINFWRDAPSEQSVRNGILEERKREGIVLRPLIEVTANNGARIIAKHKGDDFRETKTPRSLLDDEEKLQVLSIAIDIANEWVTPQRLNHVLDLFPSASVEKTGDIIRAMAADIEREGAGEIQFSKEAMKQISRRTAELFKERCNVII